MLATAPDPDALRRVAVDAALALLGGLWEPSGQFRHAAYAGLRPGVDPATVRRPSPP